MLKTISAALLAVSVLAAPALAATSVKPAPTIKTSTIKQGKSNVLNAHARMGRHHARIRHAGYHKRIGAFRTHRADSKVTVKHVVPASRRG
jgi:hypothetical protein